MFEGVDNQDEVDTRMNKVDIQDMNSHACIGDGRFCSMNQKELSHPSRRYHFASHSEDVAAAGDIHNTPADMHDGE